MEGETFYVGLVLFVISSMMMGFGAGMILSQD